MYPLLKLSKTSKNRFWCKIVSAVASTLVLLSAIRNANTHAFEPDLPYNISKTAYDDPSLLRDGATAFGIASCWLAAIFSMATSSLTIVANKQIPDGFEADYDGLIVLFVSGIGWIVQGTTASTDPIAANLVKYLSWTLTTPILMIQLCELLDSRNMIITVITLDVMVILSGVCAWYAQGTLKWLIFGTSSILALLMFAIVASLFVKNHKALGPAKGRQQQLYIYLAWLYFPFWMIFPIIWALGTEGFSVISLDLELFFYMILDLFCKDVTEIVILYIRDDLVRDLLEQQSLAMQEHEHGFHNNSEYAISTTKGFGLSAEPAINSSHIRETREIGGNYSFPPLNNGNTSGNHATGGNQRSVTHATQEGGPSQGNHTIDNAGVGGTRASGNANSNNDAVSIDLSVRHPAIAKEGVGAQYAPSMIDRHSGLDERESYTQAMLRRINGSTAAAPMSLGSQGLSASISTITASRLGVSVNTQNIKDVARRYYQRKKSNAGIIAGGLVGSSLSGGHHASELQGESQSSSASPAAQAVDADPLQRRFDDLRNNL